MSLGRSGASPAGNRDEEADYRNAYLAEYESLIAAGNTAKAEEVAACLRRYGYEVSGKTAVNGVERAVEEAPRRRRRAATAA